MDNLVHLFGQGFTPKSEQITATAAEQLISAMQEHRLDGLPDSVIFDGAVHRFSTSGKPKDKSGWYVGFESADGFAAGAFGDWRLDLTVPWRADMGRKLTQAEEIYYSNIRQKAIEVQKKEREKKYSVAADTVELIWSNAEPADADHPYLRKKHVKTHGIKQTGDGRLMLPLYNKDGELRSIQYIDENGDKLYHPNGQTKDCFWHVGNISGANVVYVAEGFATAATINEVTGKPCLVAFSAANLMFTAQSALEAGVKVIVIADNDEHKQGTGRKAAEKIKKELGIDFIMPPFDGMDANDFHLAGHDLLALLGDSSHEEKWLVPVSEFASKPAPIKWLIKGVLQAGALIMVHGPSGGGKTFNVIDWSMRIASGINDFAGKKVNHGAVVYLAGEGHHGMRARIAGWMSKNGVGDAAMWVSQSGCDLNTPQGYLNTIAAIDAIDAPPALIVIDTLHRFNSGDENSSQDARDMIQSCGMLIKKYDCSVLLVHHTGVNSEAQHRARGSSAWRGAVDIELGIKPVKDDEPGIITMHKSKDTEIIEPIFFELEQTPVPNWIDDDGEQVTTATVNIVEEPTIKKVSDPLKKWKDQFEAAWFDSGAEYYADAPYLSRSAFSQWLIVRKNIKPSTADDYAKPSRKGQMPFELINNGVIEERLNGFIVVENEFSGILSIKRGF